MAGAWSGPSTQARTRSTVAFVTWRWPTSATGASSQRPMQGARTTRTPSPTAAGRASSSAGAPRHSQVRLSQTRTVSGGGGLSPSITTSKWA